MRNLPKRTKVKNTLWKNYSLKDVFIGGLAFICIVGIVMSNLKYKWFIGMGMTALTMFLLLPSGGESIMYEDILTFIKFIFSKKKFKNRNVEKLVPYRALEDDGIIEYPEYYGRVLEVKSKEFFLETEYAQEADIEQFARAISCLDLGKAMDIVKIDRPIIYDEYIKDIEEKIGAIKGKSKRSKIMRIVLETQRDQLEYLNTQEKVYRAQYYLVVYDSVKSELNRVSEQIQSYLISAGLGCKILDNAKDVAIFLKYCNTRNFDEREADNLDTKDLMKWIMPTCVKFKGSNYKIDDVEAFNFAICDYPLTVGNAWGSELFNIDNTKVVMHLTPVDQEKAIKRVDKVCQELLAREDAVKASEVLEQETHLESMSELLQSLQNSRENFYDVAMVVTGFAYNHEKHLRKSVRSKILTKGFFIDNLYARQEDGFITANISKRSALRNLERGINGGAIAAVFPFVHTDIMEKGGVLYGYNDYPVILNIWKKDGTHRNANAMVLGRPGSGKSYFLKSLLTNSIADGCICFVIDPENEYGDLVKNIGGNMIDVGTARTGRLNPFHIYQILTENGLPAPPDVTFYAHLKTLESFFKVILEGCDHDVLEIINNLVVDTYQSKGIDEKVDVRKFKPEDFPIFNDLYAVIEERESKESNADIKQLYVKAMSYIKKFTDGGRYSDLWNKPSNLKTDNIMTVFNFQSLFANKNNLVANAQMLLVFRYLEQQVINIREINRKGNVSKRVVIVADEAHLFIDPKFPIALDFFYQMVKRIRKYNGTFIPATQNVADWNANEELRSKTSAVIKNTQYTFVFALNPADIDDLTELYRSNPINEQEQHIIASAQMGECFYMGAYNERSVINIVTSEVAEAVFSDKNFAKNYLLQPKTQEKTTVNEEQCIDEVYIQDDTKESNAEENVYTICIDENKGEEENGEDNSIS